MYLQTKNTVTTPSNLLGLHYILSRYAILLVLIRIYLTNSIFYGFMLWNLFLAYMPFFIGKIPITSKKILFLAFPVWLLFLPNAPYLVTDIFHLQQGNLMPMWFDLLLLLSFSINGLLLYFTSLKNFYKKVAFLYNQQIATLLIYSSIILSSFGMYLGRYLRWNSWEIISQPDALFNDVVNRVIHPLNHPRTWGITIGYSILFGILFWYYKNLKISATFVKK